MLKTHDGRKQERNRFIYQYEGLEICSQDGRFLFMMCQVSRTYHHASAEIELTSTIELHRGLVLAAREGECTKGAVIILPWFSKDGLVNSHYV